MHRLNHFPEILIRDIWPDTEVRDELLVVVCCISLTPDHENTAETVSNCGSPLLIVLLSQAMSLKPFGFLQCLSLGASLLLS